MKRIAILGADGFIGRSLYAHLARQGRPWAKVGGTTFLDRTYPALTCLDITQAAALEAYVLTERPDILILAAGTKDVKLCERHPEIATMINVAPVEHLIRIVTEHDLATRLIVFSSDYVFAGDAGPYDVTDPPGPHTHYGRSKAALECALAASTINYTVVRTAAVMGPGANFFDWFLGQALSPGEIRLFDNTVFSPTPQGLLNAMLLTLCRDDDVAVRAIVHAVGGPALSRYAFGKRLLRHLPETRARLVPEAADLGHSTFQHDLSLSPSTWLLERAGVDFETALAEEVRVWRRGRRPPPPVPIADAKARTTAAVIAPEREGSDERM